MHKRRRFLHRRRGLANQRGTSAVEFGLILPVLLVILLGIIDYGWVFFVRLNMTNAAREGARVGVTREDADDAKDAAEKAALLYLSTAGLTGPEVVVAATKPDGTPDAFVNVQVTVSPFTPLVDFVPTPSSMTVSAQMRWELAERSP